MASDWQNVTLGDFVVLQRGHDLTADERKPGNVPVMGAAGQNGFHDTAIAKAPGIVIGRSGGSFGQVHFSDTDYWPHNTGLYVTDFKGNDPYFAYYLLKWLNFDSYNSGSAQPSLNRNFIYPIKIRVPKPKEQTRIAAVLSALDAKIALNHRINVELEGMAKLLYDYWFVQYDFPLSAAQAAALGKPHLTGKPYRSSGGPMVYDEKLKREIPKGWEMKSISQIAPILTGKKDANHATPDGPYHFFTCADEALRCDDFAFDGRAILLAGNGSFGVKIYEGKFNAYQRTYVLIPSQEKYFASVWFGVKNSVTSLTQGSRGSIVKFLTKGDIESIFVPLPPEGSDDLFDPINNALLLTLANHQQNQELTTLRDWLLPMLMNGQVRVG